MVDRNACNAVKQREFLHTKSLLHHAYVFVSDFLSHENDLLYRLRLRQNTQYMMPIVSRDYCPFFFPI